MVGALAAPRKRASAGRRAAEFLRASRVLRNTFGGGPEGVARLIHPTDAYDRPPPRRLQSLLRNTRDCTPKTPAGETARASLEAKESLAKLNVLLRPGSPAEFAAFVAKETPVWTEMVRESGATAQ